MIEKGEHHVVWTSRIVTAVLCVWGLSGIPYDNSAFAQPAAGPIPADHHGCVVVFPVVYELSDVGVIAESAQHLGFPCTDA